MRTWVLPPEPRDRSRARIELGRVVTGGTVGARGAGAIQILGACRAAGEAFFAGSLPRHRRERTRKFLESDGRFADWPPRVHPDPAPSATSGAPPGPSRPRRGGLDLAGPSMQPRPPENHRRPSGLRSFEGRQRHPTGRGNNAAGRPFWGRIRGWRGHVMKVHELMNSNVEACRTED